MTSIIPLPVADAPPPRKAGIAREDLLAAALKLIGPNRSLSTVSLREVAREAGIAPNSFYRQFRDMDELAIALIDLAGRSLRTIIGQARQRATSADRSVIRVSVETFMEQLRADDKLLHVLLREGAVGSDAFKHAVERELAHFEDELRVDLIRLAAAERATLHEPALVSKAITRLVFAMGAVAMDQPPERDPELVEQISQMLRMIITGARAAAVDARKLEHRNVQPNRGDTMSKGLDSKKSDKKKPAKTMKEKKAAKDEKKRNSK